MAREPRRSGGERIRYGICLNDDCAKCKSKEVQQVSMRKDFVCSECGSELRECPAPKTKSKTSIIIAAALGATLLLCGGYYLLAVGNEDPEIVNEIPEEGEGIDTTTIVTEPETKPVEETIKEPAKEPVKEPVTPKANPTYGTVNLGYGTYTGDLKNGQPHGHGTIKYTKQHQIVSSKSEYIASPGDEFEGDFRNGTVSGNTGHWSHNGTVTAIKP